MGRRLHYLSGDGEAHNASPKHFNCQGSLDTTKDEPRIVKGRLVTNSGF